MKIEIPDKVKFILNTLHDEGYFAYIVGGCVRDSLLGIEPKDWDITTNASPDEVEEIFDSKFWNKMADHWIEVLDGREVSTIPTGKIYGTITVRVDDENFEVTSFRKDGSYGDGRRPNNVTFGNNLTNDLERRDFTINAIAYNEKEGLIDPFNGKEDLNNKIIKCVGSAKERFNEDALRILRAIRFALRFNFNIEEETRLAIIEKFKRNHLENVSRERVYSEFKQILSYRRFLHADMITLINKLCLYMFGTHFTNNLNMTFELSALERITGLFIDNTLLETEVILRENKFSSDEIKVITTLLNLLKGHNIITSVAVKKDLRTLDFGKGIACLSYNANSFYNLLGALYSRTNAEFWRSEANQIIQNNEPYKISQLKVNGDDLQRMGLKGKEIGLALEDILQYVLENPKENDKEKLLDKMFKSL